MSTSDTASLSAILKETYADRIVEWYKSKHVLYSLLMEGEKQMIGGKYLVVPIQIGRDAGGSPGGELSFYPTPRRPAHADYHVGWSAFRNAFELTAKAQLDTRDASMAFLKVMEHRLQGSIAGIKRSIARDMFNTRNSALAVCASNVGAAITVLDAYATSEDDLRGSRYLIPRSAVGADDGMLVHVIDPATGTFRLSAAGSATFQVFATPTTTTVTLDAEPLLLAAGDILVPEGSWDSGAPIGNSIYGLGEIIDNGATGYAALWGDYAGLNRANYPMLDSVVRDLNGVALAEDDIYAASGAVDSACGEALTPDNCILICRPEVRKNMKDWRIGDVRFTPTSIALGVDDNKFTINTGTGDMPIYSDQMATPRCLYGINKNALQVYEVEPIHLEHDLQLKQTGSQFQDIYTGFLRTGLQLHSDRPNAHFKIVDIGGTDPDWGMGTSWVKPA